MTRRAVAVVVAVGVAVSIAIAVFGAPWASDAPDGLERVASDRGFAETATESATAESPAAGYSTGAWRAAGVVLVFGLAAGATALASRRRREPSAETAASPSVG